MQPLRIGIDFDGVIVDHHPHKLHLAKEWGFALEPWQANSNILKNYLASESYERLQAAVYGDLTRAAPPVPGALEALANLPGVVYIVSARRPENEAPARAWMEAQGLFGIIPPERVIFCREGGEKRGYCERLGITLFLDDKLSYLAYLPETALRVLFDADGVASRLDVPADIGIVDSWPAFSALAEA